LEYYFSLRFGINHKKLKMKQLKVILILSVAFLFSLLSVAHAQVGSVNIGESTMSLGSKSAYSVDMSGADKKMAEKKWKEHMKDYGKVNRNRKAKEFYTSQTKIPALGLNTVNVYCKFEEGKDMIRAIVFVDNGEKFIDESDDVSPRVESFVRDYAILVEKEVAKKEMEQGEKDLKNFNKDLSKLEKQNKKLHEEIEKYKKKISEAESNIEKNLMEQDAAQETIENQKGKVEELTDYYNGVGRG